MKIENTSTVRLTLTMTKREAELLKRVMIHSTTIPYMLKLDKVEWDALSQMMENICNALS